jgi:branched-chain amino acid transport system substrate-binding protein
MPLPPNMSQRGQMPAEHRPRTLLRFLAIGFGSLMLASCLGGTDRGAGGNSFSAPTGTVTSQPLDAIDGGQPQQVQGAQAKAVLILPLSASGGAGAAARSMKNAGEMALSEFKGTSLQLVVKDDLGTPQGAAQAAQEAVGEGAQIILGPLFAQGVAAAGQVAKQSNIPVLAFSTDASAAASGVYLLSFLPQSDVERIVSYSVKNGKRSFAAILPEDAYGSVVEGAFQEAVARNGGRVVGLERYKAGDQGAMKAAVSRIAQSAAGVDAILVPDQAPTIAGLLQSAGVDLKRITLLGTGVWDDPQTLNSPALAGGLYAGPDSAGWANFSQRYQARFGEAPVRTATLAYDAVLLAAALTQAQGPSGLSTQALTASSGFKGIDGIFRLKPTGLNDRGLAVMKVQQGGAQVVSPAQGSFSVAGL